MKWTEDNIQKYLLEHPNIKTRMQLKKANFNAYDSARRLNILDNLFGNPLHVKRWTKELIYELLKEHPEIKSRTDLRKVNGRAYFIARQLNMLDELFGKPLHREKWTPELIKQFVIENNITSRNELENASSKAYKRAKEFGLLNDLFGEPLIKQWEKDECALLAQLCFSKSQFKKLYNKAYEYSLKHGWLNEICSHMPSIIDFASPGKYLIYVYEDVENNYAYIGLTNNAIRRDREHILSTRDSLYKHCKKFNIAIPEMKILKNDLSASLAAEEEKKAYENYKSSGWNMINSKSHLGSLGSKNKIKRKVLKEINNILKEHPEITTQQKLKLFYPNAYRSAWYLKILEEIF